MTSRRYTAADISHVQLTGEAMIELANKITAERDARAEALGVPRGLDIPRMPIPATVKEIQAELEIVSRLEYEAYEARLALPPGPERESAGVAMVYYRDRCSWLRCAIRDRSSDRDGLA